MIRAYVTRNSVTPESLDKAFEESWEDLGEAWHSNVLPKKFKEGATSEYGYKRRSRAYVDQKRRQFGHSRPLEFTGRLKRMVLRKPRTSGKSSGNRSRGEVSVSGPAYLRSTGVRTEYAEEIRAMSAADHRFLVETMDRLVTMNLEKQEA